MSQNSEKKGGFAEKFAKKTNEETFTNEVADEVKDAFANSDSKSIEALTKEIDELKDYILRSKADLENFKKRTLADKDDAVKYALSSVIKDIALLIDNFYLSFNNTKEEDVAKNDNFKIFFDAMKLNIDGLMKFLEKNNVSRIYPLGEKFDPNMHEAVSQIPAQEGQDSGVVIQVLSGGYRLYDRVLKPAIVVVTA